MAEWITNLDFTILDWIRENIHLGFFDGPMKLLSALGEFAIPWVLLAVSLLFTKKYRKWGILMIITLLLDFVCNDLILKQLIARVRPCNVRPWIEMIIKRPTSYSFPSGHSSTCIACLSVYICSKVKSFWIPGIFVALFTIFGRMYFYVHYPSDVLGGMLLGLICGLIGCFVIRRYLFRVKWINPYQTDIPGRTEPQKPQQA